MKSLYATLYFSSIAIPGALQASGMCHLRGRALSLARARTGTGSRQPVCPGVSHWARCTRGALGCCHDLPKAVNTSHFAPLPTPSRRSQGPQMNSGLGQFPYKEKKLLKEECGPATAELASLPANGPQRLFLHTGIWEAGFEEEIFVIIM